MKTVASSNYDLKIPTFADNIGVPFVTGQNSFPFTVQDKLYSTLSHYFFCMTALQVP